MLALAVKDARHISTQARYLSLDQTDTPAHIQTLTWKWWTSVPEGLRVGSADRLPASLKERVGSLFRFWECVARRMVIYEFYFLDPRLISIEFEAPARKKRGKSAND